MSAFEYELVIENAKGRAVRAVRRTGFARPLVGEEILVDDALYVVYRVQHQQEDRRSTRIYTWPRVFVRKAPRAQAPRK